MQGSLLDHLLRQRRKNHHRLHEGRLSGQQLNIRFSDSSPDAARSGGCLPIAKVGKSWYDAAIGPPEADSSRKKRLYSVRGALNFS